MIRHEVESGSPEWRKARLGKPTASQFHRIVKPATMAPSDQREAYMHELIAERLTGGWDDDYAGQYAERGNALESDAVAYFEFLEGVATAPGGFVTTDDGRIGCSPDRVILDATGAIVSGLEIKCPSPKIHAGYMLTGSHAKKYRLQVQGMLYVTGVPAWNLLSYHPDMPPALLRIERDEPCLRLLGDRLREFCDDLDEAHARALKMKGSENEVNW